MRLPAAKAFTEGKITVIKNSNVIIAKVLQEGPQLSSLITTNFEIVVCSVKTVIEKYVYRQGHKMLLAIS